MSSLLLPSIPDFLWHRMRDDLAQFVPAIRSNGLLMCCVCGRFLPREDFDVDHLLPQQLLKLDPNAVRIATAKNIRSKNILLCKSPLKYRNGRKLYENGCNSWKGRYYDGPIRELATGKAMEPGRPTQRHTIAALCLAYLALVAEFGYLVALERSGLMMRQQFFNQDRFHPGLDAQYRILLSGKMPTDANSPLWSNPFGFAFEQGSCVVTVRNFAVRLPVTRDPRQSVVKHLKIVPHKFKLQPDFTVGFE
jgi:hypothetical protein